MTHLANGTIVTDEDDAENNDALTQDGWQIIAIEDHHGHHAIIFWDPDLPF